MRPYLEQADLADESQLASFRGGVGVEDLDRHFSLVFEIAREVNGGERTLSDLTLEVVMSAERNA